MHRGRPGEEGLCQDSEGGTQQELSFEKHGALYRTYWPALLSWPADVHKVDAVDWEGISIDRHTTACLSAFHDADMMAAAASQQQECAQQQEHSGHGTGHFL